MGRNNYAPGTGKSKQPRKLCSDLSMSFDRSVSECVCGDEMRSVTDKTEDGHGGHRTMAMCAINYGNMHCKGIDDMAQSS